MKWHSETLVLLYICCCVFLLCVVQMEGCRICYVQCGQIRGKRAHHGEVYQALSCDELGFITTIILHVMRELGWRRIIAGVWASSSEHYKLGGLE